MAVTKRFGDMPVQALVEPEIKERIHAVAEAEGVSLGQVIRDFIDAGLPRREAKLARRAERANRG